MPALTSTRRAIAIGSFIATAFFTLPSFAQHHGGYAGHGRSGHYGLGGHGSGLGGHGSFGGQHAYSGHYGGSHGYGVHGGFNAYARHDYGNHGSLHDYGSYGYGLGIGGHHDNLSYRYSYDLSYPRLASDTWYGCYSPAGGGNRVIVNRPRLDVRVTSPLSGSPEYAEKSPTDASQGLQYQRRAIAAFREGRYEEAVRLANHALIETPRDGKLMLVLSHSFFATGDYRAAAGAIHRAASLLDKQDWGYVVKNFRDYYRGRQYVARMERLNSFIKTNPKAAYARFLRGYHYGFLGHHEFARQELAKTLDLEDRDQLAAELLTAFGGQPAVMSPNNISNELPTGTTTVSDSAGRKVKSNEAQTESAQDGPRQDGHAGDDHHHGNSPVDTNADDVAANINAH